MKAIRPNKRVGNPGPARDYHPVTNGAQLRWADSMVRKVLDIPTWDDYANMARAAGFSSPAPTHICSRCHASYVAAIPDKPYCSICGLPADKNDRIIRPAPNTSAPPVHPTSSRQRSLYGLLPEPQLQPQEQRQLRRRAR